MLPARQTGRLLSYQGSVSWEYIYPLLAACLIKAACAVQINSVQHMRAPCFVLATLILMSRQWQEVSDQFGAEGLPGGAVTVLSKAKGASGIQGWLGGRSLLQRPSLYPSGGHHHVIGRWPRAPRMARLRFIVAAGRVQ